MDAPTPLAVHLLGGFTVAVAGRALPAGGWSQRRAAAVVKLLALQPQRRLHREELMETLWPDLTSDAAANNLRVAVHRARQRLEAAGAPTGRVLTRERDEVVLGDPAETWVDVDAFTGAAQRAWLDDDPAAAERAAALYRGDLLPEDLYEEWAAHRRTDLRVSYLALLTRMATLHEACGDTAAAIATTQRLLAAEPLEEAGHATLMRLYARLGARRQALAQYDTLAALLTQELDATPDPATTALRDEIAATPDEVGVHPRRESVHPNSVMSPQRGAGAMDPDLIGRERELAELSRLLAKHRLVTLTGPAGAGKSRLAEAALRHIVADGGAGIVLELDAVATPDLLVAAIAAATGATAPETDATLEALIASLGHASLLLVLDTFEHLLGAAEVVAGLVRGCPRLTLLVTSRERLRLRAEHVYEVSPLPIPAPDEADPGALEGSPAVQLFRRRAVAADPGFTADSPELLAIAEICRRLDGLPLAIELAAARVALLPPAALLTHMARPLPLLTGGPRDAPSRQQTMRAAIAWSVDLLPRETRRLYARLGVFPASFSLPAAQAVAAPGASGPGDDDPSLTLLEGLEDLLHKHLLRRAGSDPAMPRFAMLTVIREHAGELLAHAGDEAIVRARHTGFFGRLAEAAAPLLTGSGAAAAFATLDEEHPNLRSALAGSLAADDGDAALRLAGALWRFWWQRGYLGEGRQWLAQALAAPPSGDFLLRAAALDADGVLAFAQGDFAVAGERHAEALRLARRSHDPAAAARALLNLGTLADEQGQPAEAARYLEEALAASRAAGDTRAVAVALANLGQVAMSLADYPRAAALLNESAHAFRDLGDGRSEAAILANLGLMSLMAGDAAAAQRCHAAALRVFDELGDAPAVTTETLNLGHAVQHIGDWDRAEALMEEARRRFLEMDDRSGLAFADLHLGKLALLRGDHARAEQRLTLALQHAEAIGDWVAAAESLEGLAMLLSETGLPHRAAWALGAAGSLRESLEIPLPAIHAPALAQCAAALAAALAPVDLERARALGASEVHRALTLADGEIRNGPGLLAWVA